MGTTLEHFGTIWDEFRSLLVYVDAPMEVWGSIWRVLGVFVDIFGEYWGIFAKYAKRETDKERMHYGYILDAFWMHYLCILDVLWKYFRRIL